MIASSEARRPLDARELARYLERDPTPTQAHLLEAFNRLYAAKGFFPGQTNPPLWTCCPNAQTCWAGVPASRRVHSAAVLPWIGPRYSVPGVVGVAMNLRHAGYGIYDEQWVTSEALRDLRAGRKRSKGSPFAYRAALALHLVLTSLEDEDLGVEPDGDTLAAALECTARLQAVLCSPDTGTRGSPTAAMWHNCPPFVFGESLKLLEPSVLVLFGAGPRETVERLAGRQLGWHGDVARGHLELLNRTVQVVAIAHPSAPRKWKPSIESLRISLRAEPLTSPA